MMIQRNKLNGLNNNKKKSNKIRFKQNAKNRNSIDRLLDLQMCDFYDQKLNRGQKTPTPVA